MSVRMIVVACIGVGALLLAGCGGSSDSGAAASASPTGSSASAAGQCPLAINEAWVKAADAGMTAAFAAIDNTGSKPVTITSAETAAAGMTQLHQTVDVNGTPTMQQVASLQVPPGDQLTLAPGADHIMLMDLTGPIAAGDDISITLTCQDVGTITFTAQARTYSGANESYAPQPKM